MSSWPGVKNEEKQEEEEEENEDQKEEEEMKVQSEYTKNKKGRSKK